MSTAHKFRDRPRAVESIQVRTDSDHYLTITATEPRGHQQVPVIIGPVSTQTGATPHEHKAAGLDDWRSHIAHSCLARTATPFAIEYEAETA